MYRFCYRCGAAGGICDCNPGHCFLNEHLRVHVAPVRDVDGRIDLGLCIRRRWVGFVRIDRRRVERSENTWYWTEEPSVCTFNGRLLFSSKIKSKCIAMLTQQLKHKKVNEMRSYKKWARMKRRQRVERSRRQGRLVRIERRTRVEENRSEKWKHWQYSAENPTVCTFNVLVNDKFYMYHHTDATN